MKFLKVLSLALAIVNLSACTFFLGSPSVRAAKFDDWELCHELADKTFKYHAAWAWAISEEIKKRELDKSERCKTIYKNRMNRFMRKVNSKPVSFEDALNGTGT